MPFGKPEPDNYPMMERIARERMGRKPFAWFKTDVNGKPTEFTASDVGAKAWEEQGFILTPVYR